MIPLTHHDIVRHAAPLLRAGLRVDLGSSEPARRLVVFRPDVVGGDDGNDALHVLHALHVLADGGVELVRAVAHVPSGLVATLAAVAEEADVEALVATFGRIPPSRQIGRAGESAVAARSWTLEPDPAGARLELRQVVGRSGPFVLVADVSTGAGMPADVRLVRRDDWSDHLPAHLADGSTVPQRRTAARRLLASLRLPAPERGAAPAGTPLAALPDDVLAVLGPDWRPLRWHGDRWKGTLRIPGREPLRGERAAARIDAALAHLERVVARPPADYHRRHAAARRRVFLGRLRPALALLAILAVMPIAWLLVARGGVRMHPLALGLTPLLMVGVVTLSAREIPVLEIPPLPRPLAPDRWTPTPSDATRTPGEAT